MDIDLGRRINEFNLLNKHHANDDPKLIRIFFRISNMRYLVNELRNVTSKYKWNK